MPAGARRETPSTIAARHRSHSADDLMHGAAGRIGEAPILL